MPIDPSVAYAYFQEKSALYKDYGYDVMAERHALLQWAMPFQGHVLEIGTGRGYFTALLAQLDLNVISIDADDEILDFAAAFARAWAGRSDKASINNVEFVKADARSLPFEDGHFATVISFNMWHHVENPNDILKEIKRVLASNGLLVVADFSDEAFELVNKIHRNVYGQPHPVLQNDFDAILDFFQPSQIREYKSRFQRAIAIEL